MVEGNEIPYQPWARAKKEENYKNRMTADPETNCYLPGVPRIMYMPFPFQIVQTPTYIGMLHEYVHAIRHVYVDGTPHPPGPIEWWMGDSRGRWEGDTLVVRRAALQPRHVVRSRRQFPQRGDAADRTLHASSIATRSTTR